ncbi:MAG: thioredoxin domain-containing protein [Ginsengibacter sp.]
MIMHDLKDVKQGSIFSRVSLIILIILGIITSGYLLYRHTVLTNYNIGKIDVCSAVFGKGCDNALISSVAYQVGLPLAAWGIIYFAILASIILLPKLFGKEFIEPIGPVVFFLTLIAFITSIGFLILMFANPVLFCPLCAVIHVINFFIFAVIIKVTNFSFWPFKQRLNATSNSSLSESTDNNLKLKLAGFSCVLFIAISLYFGLQIISGATDLSKETVFDPKKNLEQFLGEKLYNIPIDADDPVLGSIKSPVEIIVFSDFQCTSCRYFAQAIDELKKKDSNKFHIVYKHFPLGKACNSVIHDDVHPRACEAALASEAAKQQGKFWQFHDYLFHTNLDKLDVTVSSIAVKLGLDLNKFEEYRISKAAQNKIANTVQLANSLGIDGTPAVFLNGRPVNNFPLNQWSP